MNIEDIKDMDEYIEACEMLLDDTVAELYNIEDTYKASMPLLVAEFCRRLEEHFNTGLVCVKNNN